MVLPIKGLARRKHSTRRLVLSGATHPRFVRRSAGKYQLNHHLTLIDFAEH